MNVPAPPYPGPPLSYTSGYPVSQMAAHGGAVYHAPMTVLAGPPFTSPPPSSNMGTFVQDVPRATECPHCHQAVVTQIEHTVGTRTWLMCLFIFAAGAWPCSCIPFCVNSCKDVKHRCPSCQRFMYF